MSSAFSKARISAVVHLSPTQSDASKRLVKKKIIHKRREATTHVEQSRSGPLLLFFFFGKTEPEPREDQAPSQPSLSWIDVSQWSPVSKRHPLRCHLSAPSAIYSTKRALSGTKASSTARSIFPICCKRSPTIGKRESGCLLSLESIHKKGGRVVRSSNSCLSLRPDIRPYHYYHLLSLLLPPATLRYAAHAFLYYSLSDRLAVCSVRLDLFGHQHPTHNTVP